MFLILGMMQGFQVRTMELWLQESQRGLTHPLKLSYVIVCQLQLITECQLECRIRTHGERAQTAVPLTT